MWGEGREVMEEGVEGTGGEREKGRRGEGEGKEGRRRREAGPGWSQSKARAGQVSSRKAQKGASREVQAAMRARFSCS